MNLVKSIGLVTLLVCSLLAGCGVPIMKDTTTLQQTSQDYALVTFVRPTMFGGAIKFGLWDSDSFIGILNAKRVVQYKAAPGEHLFLARAENWSYVHATLQAGKHYVIVGKVFPGVWKARVALSPVKKNTETDRATIDGWINNGTPSEIISEQLEPYQAPRQAEVREAISKYESGEIKFEILEINDHL